MQVCRYGASLFYCNIKEGASRCNGSLHRANAGSLFKPLCKGFLKGSHNHLNCLAWRKSHNTL